MPSSEDKAISRGAQTSEGAVMGVERLRGVEGPFYLTSRGDRMHLAPYCHGQRNAGNPSKAYQICQYCDSDRPLFEVTLARDY